MKKYKKADWLREQYCHKKQSLRQMADDIDCSDTTIRRWMNKHDIERRDKNAPNVIEGGPSNDFIELVVGELLGDGSIAQNGIFWYGTTREGYRDWLANRFEAEGLTVRRTDEDAHRFRSLTYKCLQELEDRWYPDGKKRIPEDLELTPVILRQWFIGDGSTARDGSQITIKANGRSKRELDRLAAKMCELEITVTAQESGAIYIHADSRKRFYDYMADLPRELENVYGFKWPNE